MIAYTRPRLSFLDSIRAVAERQNLAAAFLDRVRKNPEVRAVVIRMRARDVLASILMSLNWRDRRIALPSYTCPSLAHAVRYSGNIPLFYDVNESLHPLQQDIDALISGGIDALILSDVYGVPVAPPTRLQGLKTPPILIGDFAHHSGLSLHERRPFDLILYSGAPYKPSAVSRFGLGLICSDRLNVSTSTLREDSLWPNLLELFRLNALRIALGPVTPPSVTKQLADRMISSDNETWEIEESSHALTSALAQYELQSSRLTTGIQGTLSRYLDLVHPSDPFTIFNPTMATPSLTYITVLFDSSISITEVYRHMASRGYLLGRIFWNSNVRGAGAHHPWHNGQILNVPTSPDVDAERVIDELRRACQA